MSIENMLVESLASVPPSISTIILGSLPVGELRGAIPIAIGAYGMNPMEAYLLAVAGNMLPVIPLLLFLDPVSSYLRKFRSWDRFFSWLFNRTRRTHTDRFERYGTWALTMFVAIPLPVTGAWTGCAAAFVFGINFRHALAAIFAGILISGLVTTLITLAGIGMIGFATS